MKIIGGGEGLASGSRGLIDRNVGGRVLNGAMGPGSCPGGARLVRGSSDGEWWTEMRLRHSRRAARCCDGGVLRGRVHT